MKEYNPDIHHRRSMRLKGCDYSSSGAYFITLCVQDHHCLFGKIVGATCRSPEINTVPCELILSPYGLIVHDEWIKTQNMRPDIQLDKFIIMPNHFHAIICIKNGTDKYTNEQPNQGAGDRQVAPTGPKSRSIGAIIGGFKSSVTKRINEIRRTPGVPVWQRNYYEYIIRNETSLGKIRQYITDNPRTWMTDKLNPQCSVVAENEIALMENPVE